MKRLLVLGLLLVSAAHAADWEVLVLLKNLQRQEKIAGVKQLPLETLNQKQRVTYQITMKQAQEQNVFQIQAKTGAGSTVLQHFEIQFPNFLTGQKSQVFGSQAGYLQAVTLGLAQICFGFSDQENQKAHAFFRSALLQYSKQADTVQARRTFPSMQASVSINRANMRFTLEQRGPAGAHRCSVPST